MSTLLIILVISGVVNIALASMLVGLWFSRKKQTQEELDNAERAYVRAIREELRPMQDNIRQNIIDMFRSIDKSLEKLE